MKPGEGKSGGKGREPSVAFLAPSAGRKIPSGIRATLKCIISGSNGTTIEKFVRRHFALLDKMYGDLNAYPKVKQDGQFNADAKKRPFTGSEDDKREFIIGRLERVEGNGPVTFADITAVAHAIGISTAQVSLASQLLSAENKIRFEKGTRADVVVEAEKIIRQSRAAVEAAANFLNAQTDTGSEEGGDYIFLPGPPKQGNSESKQDIRKNPRYSARYDLIDAIASAYVSAEADPVKR